MFKENSLFYKNTTALVKRKAIFYLKFLLGNNFPQLDKNPGLFTSKTYQVEKKPVYKCNPFMKISVNTITLKTQMIVSKSMMK